MKRLSQAYRILLGCSLLGLSLTTGLLASRESHAAVTSCVELLNDGGFEAGGQGWLQYSAQSYELVSNFNPHTGRLGTYLAGVNNANDRISQQVTLPPAVTTLTLDAWWYLATAEAGGIFDTMTVALLNADGVLLTTLLTVDNTAPVGVWDELVLDLTLYAGQIVVIQFEAYTDANSISDFYLDDVSVVACTEATPTATTTIVPTPTATATTIATVTLTASITIAPSVTPDITATSTATVSPSPPPSPASPTATPSGVFIRCYLPLLVSAGGTQ